jgi:hypothetical protein
MRFDGINVLDVLCKEFVNSFPPITKRGLIVESVVRHGIIRVFRINELVDSADEIA